nr:putative capsid protein [Crucivirus sp.]
MPYRRNSMTRSLVGRSAGRARLTKYGRITAKPRYSKRVTRVANRIRSWRAAPKRSLTMGWRSNFKRRYKPSSTSAIAAPVAYASTQRTGKAEYVNFSADSCRIRHCELLGSITGSGNFTIDPNLGVFPVNPGLQSSFPWLSTQAAAWEKYKFHKLKFIYHTKCATSVPGSVLLGMDYDAADVVPTTELQLSNFYGSVESAPWKEIVFNCNLERMQGSRYIRVHPVTGVDIKTYDQGNFYVGTVDGTAVPWGKLWVEYDVELQIPQQAPAAGIGVYFSPVAVTANLFPVINNATINARNYNISVNGDPTTPNRLIIDGLVIGKQYSIDLSLVGTTISSLAFDVLSTALDFGKAAFTSDATTALAEINFTAEQERVIFAITSLTAATVSRIAVNVAQVVTSIFTS